MLPIFQKKFVQELRDFSAASGEGCRSVGVSGEGEPSSYQFPISAKALIGH